MQVSTSCIHVDNTSARGLRRLKTTPADDIALFHAADCAIQARRALKLLCIRIPYFNNIEPTFRANRDSIDFVGRIDRRPLQHGRDDIVEIHLVCLFLFTSEGITSSADMMVALPQRRRWILHREEHPLAKRILFSEVP